MISAALVFRFERASTMRVYIRPRSNMVTRTTRRGLTIEVRVPDVHVIHPLSRETRRDLLSLLFQVKDYGQELLNVRRRNIVAIGPLDEGLALEVEYCNQACHRERRGLFTISLSTRCQRGVQGVLAVEVPFQFS